MIKMNTTGIIQVSARITNKILKTTFVDFLIWFKLEESAKSRSFLFLPFSYLHQIIALSSSNFLTIALARMMVIQHATDWKNAAADVIPIVEERSALYIYVSMVAVVLKIEPLAPCES